MGTLTELTLESQDDFLGVSGLSLEGKSILLDNLDGTGKKVYVVLTDTKSWFQRIAKKITKSPYNHVSISFDDELSKLYSFSIFTSINGLNGGFDIETPETMKGAVYSLYSIRVDEESFKQMLSYVEDKAKNISKTKYNLRGLVNAISDYTIFSDEDSDSMICSQFVNSVFENSGIYLFNDRTGSRVKPYDFVKSKLLKFERRGKFK